MAPYGLEAQLEAQIKHLLEAFASFIQIPLPSADIAAEQRVIFCVHEQRSERTLLRAWPQFESAVKAAELNCDTFDLQHLFGEWLNETPYIESYFKEPEHIYSIEIDFINFLTKRYEQFAARTDKNGIVLLRGVGYLFGFVLVNHVIERFAALTEGRLVAFFPGKYEKNNYRLLNAYDGWNYLAIPLP